MLHLIFLYDSNHPPIISEDNPLQQKDANMSDFPDLSRFGSTIKEISQTYDSFLVTNVSDDETTQNWLDNLVYLFVLVNLEFSF